MPLTPLDIRNKTFRRAFRGYDEEEVDAFLEQVMREFEQLLRDNAALREQVEMYSSRLQQYENLEHTLHNALIVAQQTADEVRAAARREAELVVEEARRQAEDVLRQAREQADALERAAAELGRRARAFRAQLRSLLQSQLELLDQEFARLGAAESAPGRGAPPAARPAAEAAAGRDEPPPTGA